MGQTELTEEPLSTGLLILLGFGAAVSGAVLWQLSRPTFQHTLLIRTAKSFDLPVTRATAPGLMVRLARRERVGLLGAAGASAVVLPIWNHWFFQPVLRQPQPVSLVLMLTPTLTLVLGRLLALTGLMAWDTVRGARAPGVRVARAFVPRVVDYVRPREVWEARLTATVLMPLAALSSWLADKRLDGRRMHNWPSLVAPVVLVLALLALAEVASRRLVQLAQPAGTLEELAWNDALRAKHLRDLYLTVTAPGLWFSVLLLADLPINGGALYLGGWALFGATCLGKPGSYYRRRLWPASQVAT